PASNMKLTTAATVLADIGAGARLTTRVYATGTLSGGTLTGSLWLVGDGDPSLSVGTFRRRAFDGIGSRIGVLAEAVRAAGGRRGGGRGVRTGRAAGRDHGSPRRQLLRRGAEEGGGGRRRRHRDDGARRAGGPPVPRLDRRRPDRGSALRRVGAVAGRPSVPEA